MQYEACGRRFRYVNFVTDYGGKQRNGMNSTVSERLLTWLDVDGSTTGTNKPTVIGSASEDAGAWWKLDSGCVRSDIEDLWMCEKRGARWPGSLFLVWDDTAQGKVGSSVCANGVVGVPCTPIGLVNHWGRGVADGLPLTMNGQITGAMGGYGWHLTFNSGSPVALRLERVQVSSTTVLMLSIPYPPSVTSFSVVAHAPPWCYASLYTSCTTTFQPAASVEEVRSSAGDKYYWDGGVLYLRVVQPPADYTGATLTTMPASDLN